MKTVSYQEYAREMEMAKKRLEEKTCVHGDFQSYLDREYRHGRQDRNGINISGTGDIPSIYAKRFAYCVEEAASIAEQFKYNGYAVE